MFHEQDVFFLLSPVVLVDIRVKVVMPTLTALLAASASEAVYGTHFVGYQCPVASSVFFNQCGYSIVFLMGYLNSYLCRPGASTFCYFESELSIFLIFFIFI
jgi:hypothetical protein